MHVQSTFIITVTAVVTNTKHTRTRSGPSVSQFLSSARRRRATRRPPRARPSLARLRASAPERPSARTPRRVPKRRARRDGRCRRHTARRDDGSSSRSRIQSTNERTRFASSRHRIARARRERGARGNEGAFVASRAHLMMNERAVARWRRRRVTRPAGVGNRDRKGSGWLGES